MFSLISYCQLGSITDLEEMKAEDGWVNVIQADTFIDSQNLYPKIFNTRKDVPDLEKELQEVLVAVLVGRWLVGSWSFRKRFHGRSFSLSFSLSLSLSLSLTLYALCQCNSDACLLQSLACTCVLTDSQLERTRSKMSQSQMQAVSNQVVSKRSIIMKGFR
jgi:hypothetical protein